MESRVEISDPKTQDWYFLKYYNRMDVVWTAELIRYREGGKSKFVSQKRERTD